MSPTETVCGNCRSPLEADRFCERCGAQNALPAADMDTDRDTGEPVDAAAVAALFALLQRVRATGVPPEGADVDDAHGFVRTLMGAIHGSERDYVAAMAVKFLGRSIPEDEHPMAAVMTRLGAGETVAPDEMGAAMAAFAALRDTLPAAQRFDRPLADLDGIGRRLAGLRVAVTPMAAHLTDAAERRFVRLQQLGLDRRIAAVAVEREMIRRGREAELPGAGARV